MLISSKICKIWHSPSGNVRKQMFSYYVGKHIVGYAKRRTTAEDWENFSILTPERLSPILRKFCNDWNVDPNANWMFARSHLISIQMNRPKTYKKHMKHASDLFWIPKDSNVPASHWQFDESYSVVHHEEFSCARSDEVLKSTLSSEDRKVLPVPTFERSGTESDWANMWVNDEHERVYSFHFLMDSAQIFSHRNLIITSPVQSGFGRREINSANSSH
jgi:hypothetical protein